MYSCLFGIIPIIIYLDLKNSLDLCVDMSRKEDDILLKQDLDDLVSNYPDRLQVVYYLSNCSSKSWGASPNHKSGMWSLNYAY